MERLRCKCLPVKVMAVVLTLLALATVGYLLMLRKSHAAIAVVIAVGGGILLSTLLKMFFDRERPDLVPHGSFVYTASFPSGHSMMAAPVASCSSRPGRPQREPGVAGVNTCPSDRRTLPV